MQIIQVKSEIELQQTKELFREYFEFLRHDHGLDISYQGIDDELAALPGHFAPPSGRLVLAVNSGIPMGCAALRPLEEEICELKRMYVRPEFRGQGVGKELAKQLIQEARDIGYKVMRLDTGNFLAAALGLYQSLGFKTIEPYNEVPEELRGIAIFMELELTAGQKKQ
jgi:putative acetyltransferase